MEIIRENISVNEVIKFVSADCINILCTQNFSYDLLPLLAVSARIKLQLKCYFVSTIGGEAVEIIDITLPGNFE